MTLRELQSWSRYIYKDVPSRDYEIITETREEWKHYHMSPGFALRHQHNKPSVIVWRQE